MPLPAFVLYISLIFAATQTTPTIAQGHVIDTGHDVIDTIPFRIQYPNGSFSDILFEFREQFDDPSTQVTDFCQTHALESASCALIHERVKEYRVLDVVTITVKRTGGEPSSHDVEFIMYAGASLSPLQQVTAFCRKHDIADSSCLPLKERAGEFVGAGVGAQDGDSPDIVLPPPPVRLLPLPRIRQLYYMFRPSTAYLQRHGEVAHLRLQLQKVEAIVGPSSHSYDIRRLFTMLDWRDWVDKYSLWRPKKLLTTFAADVEVKYVVSGGVREVVEYKYDPSRRGGGRCRERNDLHCLGHEPSLFPHSGFDLVVVANTLEHVYNPLLVMANILAVMAPGGHFFTSVPCLDIQHMTPVHFHHFTPMGLVVLLEQAGFEVLELGQWGHQLYEQHILTTHTWADLDIMAEMCGGDIIENQEGNPDSAWVLARKPTAAATDPLL